MRSTSCLRICSTCIGQLLGDRPLKRFALAALRWGSSFGMHRLGTHDRGCLIPRWEDRGGDDVRNHGGWAYTRVRMTRQRRSPDPPATGSHAGGECARHVNRINIDDSGLEGGRPLTARKFDRRRALRRILSQALTFSWGRSTTARPFRIISLTALGPAAQGGSLVGQVVLRFPEGLPFCAEYEEARIRLDARRLGAGGSRSRPNTWCGGP